MSQIFRSFYKVSHCQRVFVLLSETFNLQSDSDTRLMWPLTDGLSQYILQENKFYPKGKLICGFRQSDKRWKTVYKTKGGQVSSYGYLYLHTYPCLQTHIHTHTHTQRRSGYFMLTYSGSYMCVVWITDIIY